MPGADLGVAGDSTYVLDADLTRLQPSALPTRQVPVQATMLSQQREPVRCGMCQVAAAWVPPQEPGHDLVFFCDSCQADLAGHPSLPQGYELLRELGRGGIGVVYLARHRHLGVDRAIKMLLPHAVLSRRTRLMFLREATSQAPLAHRNIVQVHDLVEVRPGIFCIVMEYVPGPSLSEMLNRPPGRSLPPWVAVALLAQVLEALEHAHGKGLVHRDIKDGNILLVAQEDGGVVAKLSDFGLAKSFQGGWTGGVTGPQDFSGTLSYMAPEQILNYRQAQPSVDLYAAGVTMYRMLTGRLPIEMPEGSDPLLHILETPPIPVRAANPSISPELAWVVERALDKRPEHRPASARQMRHELLESLGCDPQSPPLRLSWSVLS